MRQATAQDYWVAASCIQSISIATGGLPRPDSVEYWEARDALDEFVYRLDNWIDLFEWGNVDVNPNDEKMIVSTWDVVQAYLEDRDGPTAPANDADCDAPPPDNVVELRPKASYAELHP